jgi:hypothetical protein
MCFDLEFLTQFCVCSLLSIVLSRSWFSIKDNVAQLLTRNNAIFCVGFFLIMVGMAIATQHSMRLAAERKAKAAAAATAAKAQ